MGYNASMSTFRLQTVVETTEFIRQVSRHISEDERGEFINHIAAEPTKGDIIPETGGARKIRWAKAGKGKSGGIRIIYFYYNDKFPIFLFTAYGKN